MDRLPPELRSEILTRYRTRLEDERKERIHLLIHRTDKSIDDTFEDAIRHGLVKASKIIMDDYCPKSVYDHFDVACRSGNSQIVQYILEKRSHLFYPEMLIDQFKLACRYGRLEAARVILGLIDPDLSCLVLAIRYGDCRIVSLILENPSLEKNFTPRQIREVVQREIDGFVGGHLEMYQLLLGRYSVSKSLPAAIVGGDWRAVHHLFLPQRIKNWWLLTILRIVVGVLMLVIQIVLILRSLLID